MADSTSDRVAKIVAQLLGKKPEEVIPTSRFFDDLDADSLEVMEVVVAIEEEFQIEISDDALEGLNTVGDLAALVARLSTH
jgi:acyl carrier protein